MGWITTDGAGARYAADVEAALPCMRHRGPDEPGIWHDDHVALGFARLSIIDVENSHQPLEFDDGRYSVVFNVVISHLRLDFDDVR